jgi:glycosyltransferase involved in cell wall biosynthesis
MIEGFVLRTGDMVIPMGNFTYDLCIAHGVDPEKIIVLPFPVTWSIRPKSVELPLRPTVLFCGRLIKEKGVNILVQAMKLVKERISEAQLIIVGDTDNKTYRNELERMVDSLGIRDSVSFLGWIPNDRIAELYRDSWVLVVPSIWEEGLGMVMVEAGLMGRAVIGSNLGGITDFLIDGTNGILVPPGNVDKLATAIIDVLGNRAKAIEMGNQNTLAANKYLEDFDQAVLRVQQAISELAEIK